MKFKAKNLVCIAIVLVAMFSGYLVGRIYIDSIQPAPIVAASEADLREKNEKVQELCKRADGGASVSSFSAVELYVIAEHKLNSAEAFYKQTTGTVDVNSVVKVHQEQQTDKLKRDGKFVTNKYSPGGGLAPTICSRTVYDYSTNIAKVNKNGTITNRETIGQFSATFGDSGWVDYDEEAYRNEFITVATTPNPYIISSVTCSTAQVSNVTKTAEGDYSFTIKMEGNSLVLAALYYSKEIAFSSGRGDPKWVSLEMTVVVGSDFNFKTIHYVEQYKVFEASMWNLVVDQFVDVYNFDLATMPTIEEVCA